jgi:hypothetical protein
MLAAKAERKKRMVFLGIGAAALFVPTLIIVLFLVLPDKQDTTWEKPVVSIPAPDRSDEVIAMAGEAEGFLRAGQFEDAATKLNLMRETFRADKNKKTVETFRQSEKRIAALDPQWRKFLEAEEKALELEESGNPASARDLLLATLAVIEEAEIREQLSAHINALTDKIRARFTREAERAGQFTADSRWDDAVKAWNRAAEFALGEEDREKCLDGIEKANNLKAAAEEENKKVGQFAKLLEDTQNALARREIEKATGYITKLTALNPDDKRIAGLAKRCRLETMVSVPAGNANLIKKIVKVEAFTVGAYEVTNLQYGEFISAGGYSERIFWSGKGWQWKNKNGVTAPRFWKSEQFKAPENPVVGISFYEAEAFCNWLTKISGRRYRLPTIAEWERAAAGTDSADWPWEPATENVPANLRGAQADSTIAVGKYPKARSAAGCFDIIGNAAEWCHFNSTYYARGGSWLTSLERVKSDSDNPIPPHIRSNRVGFRVVREVD